MSDNDLNIASNRSESLPDPIDLFAGDGDINTAPDIIATYATGIIPQWAPLTRDATSKKLKPMTLATESLDGITVYAVDARTADVKQSVYKGGYFNANAIKWPVGFTEAQVLALAHDKYLFRSIGAYVVPA
jgi:Bacteriophage lambda head decoration protein D.